MEISKKYSAAKELIKKYLHIDRTEFDADRVPELTEDLYIQDVHSISSLLKMYFRELPNPLFTYQLYDKFTVSIIQLNT